MSFKCYVRWCSSLKLLILLVVACHFYGLAVEGVPCSRGEKLHTPRKGRDVCIPCDDRSFMSEDKHTHRKCHKCTTIEDLDLEILVTECDRTHDTEILCQPGYYRYKARNPREKDKCETCRECEFQMFPARDCQGYNDTVCCPLDHDAVKTSEGKFECKERPPLCGLGECLNSTSNKCRNCPTNATMPARNHTHTECLRCENLSGNETNHAVIWLPCSRTAPTLFGCENGYFRDPLQESPLVESKCSPCQKCHRELRQCDMFHNTVCDLERTTVLGFDEVTRYTAAVDIDTASYPDSTELEGRKVPLDCPLGAKQDTDSIFTETIFVILRSAHGILAEVLIIFVLFCTHAVRRANSFQSIKFYSQVFNMFLKISFSVHILLIITRTVTAFFETGFIEGTEIANYLVVFTIMLPSYLITVIDGYLVVKVRSAQHGADRHNNGLLEGNDQL